jgi:hypothetical protein
MVTVEGVGRMAMPLPEVTVGERYEDLAETYGVPKT